ncbi:MAG: hypothetical protein ACYCSA_02860 [Thermoplasmataceae archaeon]
MKERVPSGRGELKPTEIPPATFEVGSSLRGLGEEVTMLTLNILPLKILIQIFAFRPMVNFILDVNIFVPIPLMEMKKSLKKKHSGWRGIAGDLFAQYIQKSGSGFRTMADLMFRETEITGNIYDFSNSDVIDLQESIIGIDRRFGEISEFISTLKMSETRTIMVAFYDRTVKILWDNRSNVLRDMLEKSIWNETDTLFYSYFNMFINVMSRMVIDLTHEDEKRSGNLTSMIGMVSAVYGSIILAYTEGVLKYELLLERMTDLSTFSGTFNIGTSRRIRKAIDASKNVAIFSE